MDSYIKALYKQAQSFEEGELSSDAEFDRYLDSVFDIEEKVEKLYGAEAMRLLCEHYAAQAKISEFTSLHYFQQGYFAAKRELEEAQNKKDRV